MSRAVRRILLAAHYAAYSINGEAAIPLQLFRRLTARGLDTWLVTHDSDQAELTDRFPDHLDRIRFVPSLPGMAPVFHRGERLPEGLRTLAWGVTQLERQRAMLPVVRHLVVTEGIDVVHQPVGVGPSMPSALVHVGAPLVIGPLNGGVTMAPAFRGRESRDYLAAQKLRDAVAASANGLIPGKRQAAVVLVANERTRATLPRGVGGRVELSSEIGVDLADWPVRDTPTDSDASVEFVFLGRLVQLKAVDLLLHAFARLPTSPPPRLTVVGDGPERPALEALARDLRLADRVTFTGWLDSPAAASLMRGGDVFVLPSLREAGGMVVIEAMASGLPVVVADWGGPAELVDDESGIRVAVDSRNGFLDGLTAALSRLADDPALRRRMGAAGRRRVEQHYDWDVLVDRLVEVYDSVTGQTRPG